MRHPLGLVALVTFATLACSNSTAASCPTCITVNEQGFVPNKITLTKGAPGSKQTLTFTRTSDDTCARDVVFPDLSIKEPLPLNKPVAVAMPTDTARTLTFQCGMGMFKSSVVVQ